MRKKLVVSALVLASVMVLGACAGKEDTDTKSKTEADTTEKTDDKKEENQDKKEDKDSDKEDTKDADDKGAVKTEMTYEEFMKLEETPAEDFLVIKNEQYQTCAVNYEGDSAYVVVPDNIDGYTVNELDDGFCALINMDHPNQIKGIRIPDSVITIGDSAFMLGESLEWVVFGENVTTIGEGAFNQSSSLKEIELPKKLNCIDDVTFAGTAIENITIPASVEKIGVNAFQGCKSLKEVVFESADCELDPAALPIGGTESVLTITAPAGGTVEAFVKAKIEDGYSEVVAFKAK